MCIYCVCLLAICMYVLYCSVCIVFVCVYVSVPPMRKSGCADHCEVKLSINQSKK